MKTTFSNVRTRRQRIFFKLLYLLLLSSLWLPCEAATGYDALDSAAVKIRNPGHTPLVAITSIDQKLVATGTHGVIVASQDNGVTWRQATVPVDLTLTSIYFASPVKGWAVGHYGVILKTDDGGSTWSKSLDGLTVIADLVAVSEQANATHPGTAATVLAQRVANAYESAGPSKPFLAVNACANGILATGQQDMAMFSLDQGRTWQAWTSQINNPNFNNIYAILNDQGKTFLMGENGMVLESTANCNDFTALSVPYTGTLFGGVVVRPGAIVLYGLDGAILKTADDGKTWENISVQTDSNITSAIKLPTGQLLFSSLGGNLYLSDQNLANIQELSISIPFQISGLVLSQSGNIIVIGNGGVFNLSPQLLH